MLTGDRPTGALHLGHYFGSIQNRVRLQDAGADTAVHCCAGSVEQPVPFELLRTAGFRNLNPASVIELCCEATPESRVIGGEDLELLGHLTGRPFSGGARKRSLGSAGVLTAGEEDGDEEVEDDGMDVN